MTGHAPALPNRHGRPPAPVASDPARHGRRYERKAGKARPIKVETVAEYVERVADTFSFVRPKVTADDLDMPVLYRMRAHAALCRALDGTTYPLDLTDRGEAVRLEVSRMMSAAALDDERVHRHAARAR